MTVQVVRAGVQSPVLFATGWHRPGILVRLPLFGARIPGTVARARFILY